MELLQLNLYGGRMKRLLGRVIAALCFCMFLASAGYGKQLKSVYLKDGGIIDCQSFWKEDGKVMVLVNRDVLVDLPFKEVDMKRTFKARKRAAVRKPADQKAVTAKQGMSGEKGNASTQPAGGATRNAVSSSTKPVAAAGAKTAVPGRGSVKGSQ